jgi:HEAT repeat protein
LSRLQDETADWELRWFCARMLGSFDPHRVIPGLMTVLHQGAEGSGAKGPGAEGPGAEGDANGELLAAVAETLGQLGPPGIAALTPCLQHPQQRPLAVRVLAQMGHPLTITPLLGVVQDPLASIRATALAALGQFRQDDRIPPVLLAALTDPDAVVRQGAIAALGRRADLLPHVDVVGALAPCLWDVNAAVTQAAAIALGRLGSEAAIAPLADVLQTAAVPDALKMTVVRCLGWLGSTAALNALATVWHRVSVAVQLELVQALGQMGDPTLRPTVHSLLQTWLAQLLPQPGAGAQKQAIALVLGRAQVSAARPLLAALLTSPDAAVRLHGEAALRWLDGASTGGDRPGLGADGRKAPA